MDGLAFAVFVCIVLFLLMITGVIKTFKRQPVVAIICMIFLFPIYLIWAYIEIWTEEIE